MTEFSKASFSKCTELPYLMGLENHRYTSQVRQSKLAFSNLSLMLCTPLKPVEWTLQLHTAQSFCAAGPVVTGTT